MLLKMTAKNLQRLGLDKERAAMLIAYRNTQSVSQTLDVANAILGGHGTEALRSEHCWDNAYFGDVALLYVNRGDTYDDTIMYDTT